METNIRYEYNPHSNSLIVFVDNICRGGFNGGIAHRKFEELLDKGLTISIGGYDMNKSLKIRQLRAMWIKQGIDQYRDAILEPYGVTSTADLSEPQLDELIKRFSHEQHGDVSIEVRYERSIILKLLTELKIYTNDCDWTHVNSFLMDSRIAGKMLYQMNMAEMKQLAIKLRAILIKQKQNELQINKIINLN